MCKAGVPLATAGVSPFRPAFERPKTCSNLVLRVVRDRFLLSNYTPVAFE
jgi:hypothetical protein